MKKSLLYPLLVVLAIFTSLTNCSEESNSLNITSITVKTEPSVLLSKTLTFTAENQDGLDITNEVIFKVGSTELEGNTYTPTEVGTINVKATYDKITSIGVQVLVIENITSLVLTSDRANIFPNNSAMAQFKVVNQLDEDVTSLVTFYQGDIEFEGNTFVTTTAGSYDFTAKYESVTSNSINITAEVNITTLTLTSDKQIIPANGNTSPVFYMVNQNSDTVTSYAKVYHNGSELVDSKFSTSTIGSFDFVAKYESLESNVLTITSEAQRTNKKILVEEFTGEWCGWCPQAAFNLDKLVRENNRVLTVGIHNGDDFEYANEATIRNAFGLNYFPSGLVGRVNLGGDVGYNGVTLDTKVTDEINRQLDQEEVLVGLSIDSKVTGEHLTVDVKANFYNNIEEPVFLTIYLIENDVTGDVQENYFADYAPFAGTYYYSQPARLEGYVHQYLLRKVATDVYGEAIPKAETKRDNIYSFDQNTISLANLNAAKCFVIAFVHYDLKGNGGNKSILNAQQVQAGSNIGFEE